MFLLHLSPEIFQLACQRIGVLPIAALVIEDSYNGIIAAKSANISCIGYKNRNSGNQKLILADVCIDNYNDLIKTI